MEYDLLFIEAAHALVIALAFFLNADSGVNYPAWGLVRNPDIFGGNLLPT
jgi:hypothetical protein